MDTKQETSPQGLGFRVRVSYAYYLCIASIKTVTSNAEAILSSFAAAAMENNEACYGSI
jgi:hypothetical protein